jgi:hypothetical protein
MEKEEMTMKMSVRLFLCTIDSFSFCYQGCINPRITPYLQRIGIVHKCDVSAFL